MMEGVVIKVFDLSGSGKKIIDIDIINIFLFFSEFLAVLLILFRGGLILRLIFFL